MEEGKGVANKRSGGEKKKEETRDEKGREGKRL